MRPRFDSIRLPVIATLMVITTLGLALSPAHSVFGATSGVAAAGDPMTEFHWEAPANMTGSFALVLRLTVDAEEEVHCTWRTAASGRTDPVNNPVFFWRRGIADGDGSATGIHAVGPGFQTHVGPLVDTRPIMLSNGRWVAGGSGGANIDSVLDVTVAAVDLELVDDPDLALTSPFSIDVACRNSVTKDPVPFVITTLDAGRQLRTFTHASMEGGAGASLGARTMSIAALDHMEQTFAADHVRLQTSLATGPVMLRQGELSLAHPTGTATWPLGHQSAPHPAFDGGPGDYAIGLTWAAVRDAELSGVLIGVDAVDSLDEVVET